MSTLEHLSRYAKVSGAGDERLIESQENFTTEALAEAIRRNPRPILLALGRAGIIEEDEVRHARVAAVTQWPMPASAAAPSYGFIDLVLHLTKSRHDGLVVAGDSYNDPELPRPSPDRRSEARSRHRAARQEVPECKRFPRNSPTCCARK